MRCPRLRELPPAPEGKTGWPWTEETFLEAAEQTSSSPRSISIVTPSYNQAAFLEETIRSVLLQGYANLEYIVMDGGSSDGSLEIIKKYEKHLAYWTSQIYRAVEGMDISFECAFDTDLFVRFASKGAKFSYIRRFVACARLHQA